MERQREQVWLIVAGVLGAHGLALAGLVAYWLLRGVPAGGSARSIRVSEAAIVVPIKPEADDRQRLGEELDSGASIARVDSPTPQATDRPDAFDQAWTRRQPRLSAPSRRSERPTGEEPATAARRPAFGPERVAELRATPASAARVGEVSPGETSAGDTQATAVMSIEAAVPTDAVADAPAGSAAESDPAALGQSDLDPFATKEGASFTPGGVAARTGREVKLVRPRIELAFMADATRLTGGDLVVGLSIETDGDGRPRRVEVMESSGSATIDDAVRLAMYDSWFGGPQPDRFAFTVRFVRR